MRPRVAIGILDDGTPGLELADPDGKKRASITLTPDGISAVEMMARTGRARVTLSASAEGRIALVSFDEKGAQVNTWP